MSKFQIVSGIIMLSLGSLIFFTGYGWLGLGLEGKMVAILLFLVGLTFTALGVFKYGGLSIAGLPLFVIGLVIFIFPNIFGDIPDFPLGDFIEFMIFLIAPLFVLAGLVLTIAGVMLERETFPIGMPTVERVPTFREEMRRKGKTEFQGTVVGKPYEIDLKKSWAKTGQISKFKAALKIKIVDKEGNPLGVTEVVFEDRDNYKALHDGDNVWIWGKWNKDGRVVVKEAQNLTTRTMVKRHRRFGWLKKVVVMVVVLMVLYIIYNMLISIIEGF